MSFYKTLNSKPVWDWTPGELIIEGRPCPFVAHLVSRYLFFVRTILGYFKNPSGLSQNSLQTFMVSRGWVMHLAVNFLWATFLIPRLIRWFHGRPCMRLSPRAVSCHYVHHFTLASSINFLHDFWYRFPSTHCHSHLNKYKRLFSGARH